MNPAPPDPLVEARLDAWLATSRPPTPPPMLRARILARCTPDAASRPGPREALVAFWRGIGGLRIAAPAFALALAAGIGIGVGLTTLAPDESSDDLLSLALAGNPYQSLLP